MSAFIPPDFSIPSGISTPEFRLRMLTVHDLVKDFDAVITSADRLRGIFGPDNRWPEGLTLEQDLIDLGWHQKEFQLRRSFAYTVMSLDEAQCLGCVYVEPSKKPLAMRASSSGLDKAKPTADSMQRFMPASSNGSQTPGRFQRSPFPGGKSPGRTGKRFPIDKCLILSTRSYNTLPIIEALL